MFLLSIGHKIKPNDSKLYKISLIKSLFRLGVILMKLKRKETFRFQFEEPIECFFRIIKIENKEISSKVGKGNIYDISAGGLKLSTPFYLALENKKIEIEISFSLNDEKLTVTGLLVWAKEFANQHSYGLKLTINDSLQRRLIEELKTYSKGIAYIKKKSD